MSFSHETKNELSRLMPRKRCCLKAELAALVLFGGVNGLKGKDETDSLAVNTENAATARKVFKLFKALYPVPVKVGAVKKRQFKKNKVYVVKAHPDKNYPQIIRALGLDDDEGQRLERLPERLVRSRCCKRAYLRGAFLARGSVNKPEGEYHLEITCATDDLARDLQKLMEQMRLESKISERKNSIVLYIKESEQIADFLRIAGASSALLEFENVRVVKSVRNQVNRQVNCETANLGKTVAASMRQSMAISRLIDNVGLQAIPQPFREVAVLRLEHPDYSLRELGSLMNPPLSKSGVAYRMRRLEDMAEKLLGEKS